MNVLQDPADTKPADAGAADEDEDLYEAEKPAEPEHKAVSDEKLGEVPADQELMDESDKKLLVPADKEHMDESDKKLAEPADKEHMDESDKKRFVKKPADGPEAASPLVKEDRSGEWWGYENRMCLEKWVAHCVVGV